MEKTNPKQIVWYIFILIFIILFLGGLFVLEYQKYFDRKLHIVFCDVGQGDGIFIRTAQGKDILIDGGPDDSVLNCLSNSMPFWDRTIDLILLSHPHQDHFVGLIDTFERFNIRAFATEKLINETQGFEELEKRVRDEGISWQTIEAGDKFRMADGLNIHIAGPSREYLLETSQGGKIGEKQEFASLILHISFGSFDELLTGDSQVSGITDALAKMEEKPIEVFQIPHHGSKTGIDQNIMKILQPKLAVISVGKNRYGHPSEEILRILRDQDIKILRTDKNGPVEIISNGKEWKTRLQKGGDLW